MTKKSLPQVLRYCLVVLLTCFAAVFTLAFMQVMQARDGLTLEKLLLIAATLIFVLACWFVWDLVRHASRGMERLQGAIMSLANNRSAVVPLLEEEEGTRELHSLYRAVAHYQGRVWERAEPDRRMTEIMAAFARGVLVVTGQGQISMVNYAAKELLGEERMGIGTSVFSALERESLMAAVEEAGGAGKRIETKVRRVDGVDLTARVSRLPEDGGAVISFPLTELERHRAELEHDLGLHDVPPAPAPLSPDRNLDDLSVLVLDAETTGLNVQRDRVVSLGGVRMHGTRLYRSWVMDRLVNPGRNIPKNSTGFHGITDGMVRDAPPFAGVYEEYLGLVENTVVVGHNIPFDLTILRRECERAGLTWQAPCYLDTLLLAYALEPDLQSYELEALAKRYGVDVHGRHTALGDSLVTGELYARMIPRLAERGVRTLEQAMAFSARAKTLLGHQRRAGWDVAVS